jgi:hypothetical protein
VADRKRAVAIGTAPLLDRDEALAGHAGHRAQDSLVVDPPTAELALDHRGPLGVEVGRAAHRPSVQAVAAGHQKM